MNIVLTGFMGTGKTSVGKLLAQKTGFQYFDTDELIEKDCKMKISEIFARKGEPFFREVESKAVLCVSLLDRAVISCGGGVVLRKVNMDELEKTGKLICLTASPETILERTKNNSDRPLLQTKDPLQAIKILLDSRSANYKRCHLAINTDNLTIEEITDKIIKFVKI